MKRIAVVLALLAAGMLSAGEFLQSLPPEKFRAAGLEKLTPAELAALEQLIAEHRGQGAQPPPAPAPAGPGWLRALITLDSIQEKPEEAGALESRLVGDYSGWNGRTLFRLENGQVWQQAAAGERYDSKRAAPMVRIYPGMLGVYWLEVEGVRERVKVKPVKLR